MSDEGLQAIEIFIKFPQELYAQFVLKHLSHTSNFFFYAFVYLALRESWASFPNGVAYPQLKSSQLLNGWNSQGDLKKKCSFSDPLTGTL